MTPLECGLPVCEVETLLPDAFPPSVQEIIELYNDVIQNVDQEAELHMQEGTRAYGGAVRMKKGKMVEKIGKSIISIAWRNLDGHPDRLSFTNERNYKVRIDRSYLEGLPHDIREYIEQRIDQYFYRAQVDIHTFIDGSLVLGVECKTYTENAMLKRVLCDFSLLKTIHPDLKCCLLQLESQLGGDYSNPWASTTYGSESTHTLMSHFKDVELDVVTLLMGERKVEKPIHDPDYFKPLLEKSVNTAILKFENHLRPSL